MHCRLEDIGRTIEEALPITTFPAEQCHGSMPRTKLRWMARTAPDLLGMGIAPNLDRHPRGSARVAYSGEDDRSFR